ncbi:hypothetical protein ACQKWADRAFT_301110 [Trichoderma austrokoningii]
MTAPSAFKVEHVHRPGQNKAQSPTPEPPKRVISRRKINSGYLEDLISGKVPSAAEQQQPSERTVDYTFGDSGSSWRMTKLKAVYTAAWAISFEQIERNDKVASDILSFLGVLHYQAMPITFIELYCRLQYRNNDENSISFAVSRALDLLKSFSLISVGTGQEMDMHRLVHLVLQKGRMEYLQPILGMNRHVARTPLLPLGGSTGAAPVIKPADFYSRPENNWALWLSSPGTLVG